MSAVRKFSSMKKRRQVIAVLAAIVFLGGLIWLMRAPRTGGSLVTIAPVTNSTNQSSGGAVFRLTNGDALAILLTDLIVETNSPAGWQAFSHTQPTHPQRLATGDIKDLVIAPPGGEKSWRLRVTYGKDVKGLTLLVGKARFAISRHSWPGPGFGIMAGGYACVSGEMTR